MLCSGYFYKKDTIKGETMHSRKADVSFTADFVWSSDGFDAHHDHLSSSPHFSVTVTDEELIFNQYVYKSYSYCLINATKILWSDNLVFTNFLIFFLYRTKDRA